MITGQPLTEPHNGISKSDNPSAATIPFRRPATCERWPKTMAPTTAPMFAIIRMLAAWHLKFVHLLEKIRIKILRSVRKEHHKEHKHDEIREALPLARYHAQNLAVLAARCCFQAPIPAPSSGYTARERR